MRGSALRTAAAALALLVTAAGCRDLPLPPEVPSGGEPGATVYTAGGAFERVGYDATGGATYTMDANGQAALTLSQDFSVSAVPRTSVFLSNSPDLERAVKVGALKAAKGGQRWTFQLPQGTAWTWVVLWSEDLWVGVARARLRPL